ncbi:TPA: hypothetical protein EYP66_20485 [Candidatus Poribacteria bacterium]|nr:hypothetical protein [Candidatus Poribacteria bacterium]
MKYWLAKPHQTEPQILKWRGSYPDFVELDSLKQYIGLKAYSITITDKSISPDNKSRLLAAVPHAHEPAGTVACMNFIHQILTGQHLVGIRVSVELLLE